VNKKYLESSCHPEELAFYRPIEAALRWCGLYVHEAKILRELGEAVVPERGQFPQWPCLRVNAEKILYAMVNGELPFGRDGRQVSVLDHVADDRKTVGHQELRAWIEEEYPQQRPAFLFDNLGPLGSGADQLAQNGYWRNLERMAAKAIEEFPAWKKSVSRVQKTGNLKDWLQNHIGASDREAIIITKILSENFKKYN